MATVDEAALKKISEEQKSPSTKDESSLLLKSNVDSKSSSTSTLTAAKPTFSIKRIDPNMEKVMKPKKKLF